jgi:phage/plasmid-associated DNA primase
VLFKLIRARADWYREHDLKAPETILQVSSEYLTEQSAMTAFVDECCDRSNPFVIVTLNEVWPFYVRWCDRSNEWPCARRNFASALERMGIKITRTRSQCGICNGLQLKPALGTQQISDREEER